MKKWMAAAAAGLLLWNIWLTVQVNNDRGQARDPMITNQEELSVVNNTIEGYTTDVTEVAEEVMQKLVSVSLITDQGEQIYSGVIYSVIGTDTWILTTSRAVSEEAQVYIRFDNGLSCEGEYRGSDDLTGIAMYVTHPEFAAEPIRLGSSAVLKQGEYVLAMGGRNLHTQSGDVSFGVVSKAAQKYREDTGTELAWINEAVFTNMTMTSQMPGGALVNLSGQMVGMLTDIYNNERSGLAAAAGTADITLAAEELQRSGEVTRGYLGAVTKDIKDLELYQKSAMNIPLDLTNGLVIVEVIDSSPAQEAGLQANDVIQSADDVLLSSADSLRKVLYNHAPEESIDLDVIRGDAAMSVAVTLK